MVNKHMKRYSISLIIREMEVKTTMRYHLTPVRIKNKQTTTANKTKQTKKQKITSVDEAMEKLEPCALLVGM